MLSNNKAHHPYFHCHAHQFSFPFWFSFGYFKATRPDNPERSINICMYLDDVPAGGHTAFPRWRNGETSEFLKVKPEKGKALIFYMLNPDGNFEDLSHHAGMPPLDGEKWFTNLVRQEL